MIDFDANEIADWANNPDAPLPISQTCRQADSCYNAGNIIYRYAKRQFRMVARLGWAA